MSSFLFGIVLALLFVAVDFSKVFHEKNSNIHNNGEEKRVDKFKNYPDIKRSTLDGSSTNGYVFTHYLIYRIHSCLTAVFIVHHYYLPRNDFVFANRL